VITVYGENYFVMQVVFICSRERCVQNEAVFVRFVSDVVQRSGTNEGDSSVEKR